MSQSSTKRHIANLKESNERLLARVRELEQENQKMREANERWESAIRRVCGTPEPNVRLPNPLT